MKSKSNFTWIFKLLLSNQIQTRTKLNLNILLLQINLCCGIQSTDNALKCKEINVTSIEQKRFFCKIKATQIELTFTFHFVTFRITVALVA